MAVDKNKLIAEATKFVQKGQWDKAIKAYERIVAEDPRDVRVLLKIGELQQKKDDPGAAATTMHSVAEVYTEQGFFLKAVAVYKQIVRLTPDDIRVNERLAALYQQLGLMSDATAQMQLVAAAAERSGDDRRLSDVLRRMTDLDPENPGPAAKLGELLARQGDAKGALDLLRRSAEGLKKANRLDEYLRVAERIAALEPGNVALGRELARLYLSRGDTRRALAKLQLCFKSDPDDVETLNLLAQAFRELGQVSKTASVYKELARIHADRGRTDEARLTWKRVLELVPDDPDALDALELDEAGEAEREPAPASAGAELEPAAELEAPAARPIPPRPARAPAAAPQPPPSSPVGPDAIPKLITETDVYLKYGLHAKAAEHLEKVFAVDPGHLDARERMRDLRAAMGDVEGAVEHGAWLARGALRAGDAARARAAVDALVALAPGHAVVAALREELAGGAGGAAPEAPEAPEPPEPFVDEPVDGADVLVEVDSDEALTEELELGTLSAPPEVESGVALTGSGAGVDLDDDLAEIDFYLQQQLFDEAREALTSLRALYPDELSLKEREEQLERALEDEVARVADAPPEKATPARGSTSPELHYSVDDALRQFRKGIEQQIRPEDAETHFDLGIAYKEMGLLDEALRELGVALAARPGRKEVDALTMIGLCRIEKGDAAGAIAAYRAALASEHLGADAAPPLHYELAMAYRALGDVDAALWFLNKVLREDPAFRDARGQVAALGDGEGRPPPDDPEAAGAHVAASS
jgi:tetratricopeptide (TPR) repeat protein